ncbi:MAG: MBL fold metallo-hydrolase [Chloroflexi bacterium]|jgi:glyoxylase-like metal-dependent hydrolase (beta-lactamase superfamily II)|nr:MBL fold metallo-hydrolase [Chloroflexota bacterium]MBT7081542.1 MBL fold metallo-hydrolase [Chloroflexota bacterium]MBT7289363.1 MBL fold metallo-hydrolase [Chloroflexota bacterium]
MNQSFCVYNNVFQIGGSDISHPADCAVYLIDCGDLVLIDSGAGLSFDHLIKNIQTLGFNPEKLVAIIATHRHIDHIGALWQFREKYGVQIIAHELDTEGIEKGIRTAAQFYDIEYRPCQVDIELTGNNNMLKYGEYELNILHVPGHTAGGIAVYVDIGKRILFGQDIHGPYSLPGADKQKAKQSLQKLIDIQADILCEGHFGIYQPKEKVNEYINSYLGRL